MELEEMLARLKKSYEEGKITKELYDKNIAKLKADAEKAKAMEPAPAVKPAPVTRPKQVPAAQPKPASAEKPKEKVVEDEIDVLEDLFKREPPKVEVDDDDLGIELTADTKEEALLDEFMESLELEEEAKPVPRKPASDEDDELLLDELMDSLVLRDETEFDCPLCGTTLPKDTQMCTNCNARLDEAGELMEEVAIDGLADSIEDGLAELEGIAEEIIQEEVTAEAPKPEPVHEVQIVEVEGEKVEIPDKLDITEEELPKVHLFGMRYVDIIILVTVILLLVIFATFKLWAFENMTAVSTGLFFGIALMGFLATFLLFRISTSAIAAGDRQFRLGNYGDALNRYERAVRFSNKPATAWTSKGVAQKRLGEYGAALKSHNIALNLDPKNEVAWCNKGDLLYRLGRLEMALECYDNAIDINKRYAIAWNNKGTTLARLGNLDKAKHCQDIATRLKPKYTAAWVNKGEILAKLGRRDEAKACYIRARKLVAS